MAVVGGIGRQVSTRTRLLLRCNRRPKADAIHCFRVAVATLRLDARQLETHTYFLPMKRLLPATLAAALLAGCAAPITYYSRTEDPSKPGTIRFHVDPGVYSTVVLYVDPYDCRGIQRVTFFKNGVDEVIHVPRDKVVTFSVYVQKPGGMSFQYSSMGYTVPFTTGELRVDTRFDATRVGTVIESYDPSSGWHPVQDIVERPVSSPLLESGPWCRAEARFAH